MELLKEKELMIRAQRQVRFDKMVREALSEIYIELCMASDKQYRKQLIEAACTLRDLEASVRASANC
jgi:hypothetical protein